MFQIPNSSILFCMQRTAYRTIRNFETANRKCIRRLPPKLIIRYVIESYWPFALYELSKSQSEISSENFTKITEYVLPFLIFCYSSKNKRNIKTVFNSERSVLEKKYLFTTNEIRGLVLFDSTLESYMEFTVG